MATTLLEIPDACRKNGKAPKTKDWMAKTRIMAATR
jgi:hypothetical protein